MSIKILIIDDDLEMNERPLYLRLVQRYGQDNIIWKEDPNEGISYIKENLNIQTIIILDYDFGHKSNCVSIFQEIQYQSSLLYVILNTAKDISDIPTSELKMFLNNHLMALVDKTDGYTKTLEEVEKAIGYLNNRVDCILEEWILRHERFTREKPYIRNEKGEQLSLNDVLNEIRKDSEFGRKMSKNIINLAISMMQKDIEKLNPN